MRKSELRSFMAYGLWCAVSARCARRRTRTRARIRNEDTRGDPTYGTVRGHTPGTRGGVGYKCIMAYGLWCAVRRYRALRALC
eukprot:3656413-Prymnesium_polylepis.1